MNKRDVARFRSDVWDYLGGKAGEAYESGNEADFDWYSDGHEAFFQVMTGRPIEITPRVKPLPTAAGGKNAEART